MNHPPQEEQFTTGTGSARTEQKTTQSQFNSFPETNINHH